MTDINIIGVDVSKNKLDIFVSKSQIFKTFSNTNVRGLDIKAKTGKIDAKMLAMFGIIHAPKAENLLSKDEKRLQDLVARRRQLTDMVRQEKCRLEKTEKDTEIKALIAILPKHKMLYEMLVSEAGVGNQTAFMLLSELPELGMLDGKKIAALIGVAPIPKESGNMKKESHIKGGRRNVRSILYMATVVASRFNQKFKEIYKTLIAKGKKPKVALTAVMRRMIVVLNAKARDIIMQNNFA